MVKYLPILFFVLAACSKETAETGTDSVSYNIDAGRISASGVSSGAYMAGQLHLAHSAIINGVAVVSGGPYYCAMGELTRGLGPCMKGDGLDIEPLIDYARQAAQAGKIDDLANLRDDRVYTFHGTLDALVNASVTDSAAAMYAELIAGDAITRVRDVAVIHGWPTLATGLPCDTFGAPYLNACNYDTAGEIFKTLYGELNARTSGQRPAVDDCATRFRYSGNAGTGVSLCARILCRRSGLRCPCRCSWLRAIVRLCWRCVCKQGLVSMNGQMQITYSCCIRKSRAANSRR